MSVGEKIIDAMIEGKLFTATCPDTPDSNCLIVWSANAPEQLTALVQEHDVAAMRAAAIEVLEWYYRDGSVGGACEPMDVLREAVGVTPEWLLRK